MQAERGGNAGWITCGICIGITAVARTMILGSGIVHDWIRQYFVGGGVIATRSLTLDIDITNRRLWVMKQP